MDIFSRDKEKAKKKRKHSFSLRVIWFFILLAVGMVPILAGNRVILAEMNQNERQSWTARLQSQWQIVTDQVSKSGYMDNPQNETINAELLQMANFQNGRVLVINRSFKIIKDTFEIDNGKYNISKSVLECFSGSAGGSVRRDDGCIEFTQPVFSASGDEVTGVVQLLVPTSYLETLSSKMQGRIRILELIEAVLLVLIAGVLANIMVHPFYRVAASLTHATENTLEEEIAVNDFVETRVISDAYNKTLKRLRQLDESRQQFVSNVSHELKTPITSIRVLADSLIGQENVPVELYQEFMQDISEEIDRESQIIEDLLALVRLNRPSAELNITQININEILEATMKRLRPIAQQKNVALVLESFRPVLAEIDKTKFTLAISNLVENAIKYNNRDGWVHVALNADHKFFYIKVSDNGIGIPEKDLEHVFERFYRVDKARSREAGGTGLGLAITQRIIQSHHGAIKVASVENEGTTFTVRIPLIYII